MNDQTVIDDLAAELYAHCTVDELRELTEAVDRPALGADPVNNLTELAAACLNSANPLPEPIQKLVDGVLQEAAVPSRDVQLLTTLLQSSPEATAQAVVHLLQVASGQACLLGALQARLLAKQVLVPEDLDAAALAETDFENVRRGVFHQLVTELTSLLVDTPTPGAPAEGRDRG